MSDQVQAAAQDTQVQKLAPQQAWDLVQRDPRAVLIDVRSSMEHLFVPPLQRLVYREEGHAGDMHVGWRGMALLVARQLAANAPGAV